jgi:hypothetical protein
VYSFFVLGIIPGTNLQITFQIWADSLLLAVELLGIAWLYRQHHTAWRRHSSMVLVVACRFCCDTFLSARVQLKDFILSQNASWQ